MRRDGETVSELRKLGLLPGKPAGNQADQRRSSSIMRMTECRDGREDSGSDKRPVWWNQPVRGGMKKLWIRGDRLPAIIIGLFCAGFAAATAPGPCFEYHWQGGRAAYQRVELALETTGVVRVTLDPRDGARIAYATEFSDAEHAGFLACLRAAGSLAAAPPSGMAPGRHAGHHEARCVIRLDGVEHTGCWRDPEQAEPLTTLVWQLVAQAAAMHALTNAGDWYHQVAGAVNPRLAGTKVLQPDRFKAPLMTAVRSGPDRSKLQIAMESLAWVTTPLEFAGFVALELASPRRATMLGLIGSDPFCGNIPATHLHAMGPVYFDFVKTHAADRDRLTPAEQQAWSMFVGRLGTLRYQPALPMLKDWFDASSQHAPDAGLIPLARLGRAGLAVLVPALDDPREARRQLAIELIVIAARGGPRAGFADPLSEPEYRAMRTLFETAVLPRLKTMAESDPAPAVRLAARKAGEEIRRHLDE